MNIYTGLLFQQGYIQDSELALSLARTAPASGTSSIESGNALADIDRERRDACKPFRRGAIAAICSIALSPFR